MRQQAWLSAVPKAPNEKAITDADKRTRQARREDEGFAISVPDVSCDYLVRLFFEIGPTLPGAMGPTLLTHGELRAYQQNVGVCLTPWEVRTIRRLSGEWIAESQKAEKPDCPAPYMDVNSEEFRVQLPGRLKSVLRG